MNVVKTYINSLFADRDGHVYVKYMGDEIGILVYLIFFFICFSILNGVGVYSFMLDKAEYMLWRDSDLAYMIIYGIPITIIQIVILASVFIIIEKIKNMKMW